MAENGEIARLRALLACSEADLQRANAQIASLEASERRYRAMFDGIDEGLCIIEMIEDEAGQPIDYRFLQANAAFVRQTGLEDAMGRTVRDMVPGHEQHWFDIYGRIARTGIAERFEDRAEALGRWYDVYAMPFGAPGDLQVAVLFRDVLDRKQTEMRLVESENRLAAIFESAPVGIALADRNGNMLLANAEAQRLFPSRRIPSHDPELGPRWRAVSDDGEAVALSDYPAIKALNGIRTVPGMEFTRTDEDGAVHWATVSSVPLRDDGGTVSGSVIVIHDVDELKRSQEALRESERRLQMLLAELQHRVRNILTVIRSVFSRTVETGGDIQSIANHFTGRLDNLARAQMVATQSAHGYADLENLVRDELLSVGVSDGENVTMAAACSAFCPHRSPRGARGPHGRSCEMPASLVGKRILVVEDEYFIAADLRNGLVEQAVTVIGPTGDLATALEMLSGEKPDAAVLDINLNDQLSWPLAIELRRRAIPFLFVTGYDSWYLPEAFRDVPQLAKPFSMEVLIGTLSGLVGVPDA